MTKRNPVSATQNVWFDAEQVDAASLNVEQNYNNSIQSAIVNNHFGTGILVDSLQDKILFDSELAQGLLDGEIVKAQSQPSDNNYGNQLEIILSNSSVAGKRAVKIAIIGLDFEQNLQYETFYFKVNESQVTKKHYTAVLQILINDFRGNSNQSFNLGGKIIIKEANPYYLSRDASMLSQTIQPNLFFRDFFTSYASVLDLLRQGLTYYNVDNLNIQISPVNNRPIEVNDVVTQIGQKFQANTNNIQKITLLLSSTNVNNNTDDYKWNGEIVVSVYPLQTALQCPTDIPPETLLDYLPAPTPLAQLSFNYDSLKASGVQLTTVPQPVEFVFSNTALGNGYTIVPGNYYVFTIKRSGNASLGTIFVSTGQKTLSNSRATTASVGAINNGLIWTDLTDEDLWFNISTDAAKVTDGQAYVSGNGVILPKVTEDSNTGATVDYCLENLYFNGNDVYKGVVFAETEQNTPIQDLRTGNLVFSRQEFVPSVKLLGTSEISNLQQTTDPLLIGSIEDKNVKFLNNINFDGYLQTFSFIDNKIFIKIVTDQNDPRYNEEVKSLQTQLLIGSLNKAKIFPDYVNKPNSYYRVASSELLTMLYGDVNGDGVVDDKDYELLNSYIGFNFNQTPPAQSTFNIDIVNNTITFVNGYYTYKYPFKDAQALQFSIVDAITNKVIVNGVDGAINANADNLRLATFSSSLINFKNLPALGGNKLIIKNSGFDQNNGGFEIVGLDDLDNLTIRKILLNEETIPSLFRCDIDGNYQISFDDSEYLKKYINKSSFIPPTNLITDKIGKEFKVIKLSLEKYDSDILNLGSNLLDRNDDYCDLASQSNRNSLIHLPGDLFLEDSFVQNINIKDSYLRLRFEQQLSWEDYLVVSNSINKLVSCSFDSLQDTVVYSKQVNGINVQTYNMKPGFNPGRVDSFVPDNLIIGPGGEIVRENGEFYKVDFEVGTIVLEIPPGMTGAERDVDVFGDFVCSYDSLNVTRLGFPAMKFADGSFVQPNGLLKDQIRISVSIQSFSPNNDGVDPNGIKGVIVDGKMGVNVNYESGVVTLNFTNLYQDPVLRTLSTRVQINVFLKKAGFNNTPLIINSDQTANILKLMTPFGGPAIGGVGALVDLETDVVGVLPIANGGTALDAVGPKNSVLSSDGTKLVYSSKLDPSLYYKNPVYIYGSSGYVQNSLSSSQVLTALPFSFESFILQDIKDICLEVVVQSFSGDVAQVTMQQSPTGDDIYLIGNSLYLGDDTGTQFQFFKSKDLKSQLINYPSNSIYILRLNSVVSGNAVCTMARLVITYNNPDNGIDFQPLPP